VSVVSTSVVSVADDVSDVGDVVVGSSVVLVDGSVVDALLVGVSVVSVESSLGDDDEQPGRKASAPVKNGRVWIKKPSRMGHRGRV